MTEWHTVRARFTSEEKRILDTLHDVFGWSHNYSLKMGIEILSRLFAAAEYQTRSDSKIIQKINKIARKYQRLMNSEIKQMLKEFPIEQQKAEYEKFVAGREAIFTQFGNVFVKNRKKGRKKLPRKRGKPSTRL